jgi:hypothetical protein
VIEQKNTGTDNLMNLDIMYDNKFFGLSILVDLNNTKPDNMKKIATANFVSTNKFINGVRVADGGKKCPKATAKAAIPRIESKAYNLFLNIICNLVLWELYIYFK